MKTTIVPAQITSVEDKITGSLTMTQLALLGGPAFIGAGLYLVIPPALNLSLEKVVLWFALSAVCCALSIRVQGKLVLWWVRLILTYFRRPRHFVFDKNDAYLRNYGIEAESGKVCETAEVDAPVIERPKLRLGIAEISRLEAKLDLESTRVSYRTNKTGGLDVYISEVG